ncbi:hypothetical protein RJ639_046687 [Escallonia herrerae]|uniref:RNase H type-1 domain-containing protein n=1 Tax=Escallonia herrerae TaxID=1293975 RepID=A0AA88WAM2_9ASTE|nr:hypothetical protein RJ639_046687 [Escallonia herrerae]
MVNTLQQKLDMAVAPRSTHHSHLDPSDLHLHRATAANTGRRPIRLLIQNKKGEEHVTRSGSCYRGDPSVEDSADSSPAQVAKAETPRRSIHRKKTPEFRTQERDPWKMVPRDHRPERSPPKEESGYPLSEAIEKAKLPPNFQMPQYDLYDETGDPGEHVSDAVMCRAFPTTLRKAAPAWFKSLQPRSVHSFAQLSDLFQKHFVSSRSRSKNSASLLNVVQEKNESLACFLGQFNAATLEINNLDESVKYTAFLHGLQSTSKFAFSVNKSPPGNMKALLEKAKKYIQAEEYLETHRGRREERKEEQKKRSWELTPQGGKSSKRSKHNERRPKDLFASENLTPLNAKPSQILHEIKDNKALQWPDKMRSRPNKRNKDLWCHYHHDHGHTTDNCGSLKRAIEALIKRGQLRKFIAHKDGRQQTPQEVEEREDREEHAGLAAGGSSGKSRKAYAREVCITSQNPSKKQKTAHTPLDDPLVITIKAGNFEVKSVLVDNGSSVEILFYEVFRKMNISTDRLQKMDSPLYGFSNHPVAVKGIIALLVAIGTPPTQANLMLDFMVVKVPSAYNTILGRSALNLLQAVVSTYHLKMKFPTEHGIGEVKGDQTTARQCYVTSCRLKKKEALIIKDLREDTKIQRGESVENLVSIEVYPREEKKTVWIGSNLKANTKLELVNLLRTYADVFAWTAADTPGIDPKVITHRLNVDPSKKPIKQKKRTFAPERHEKIEEETLFEELKTYLSSPPLLSKPFPGEDLFLYLSVAEVAVSAVLVREGDGVQKLIYYVSNVLQDVETRYPKIDRIALALITSARRLRPHFQSHSIIVLTNQPLRKVLLSPEASGRLVTDPWNLYVDDSSAVGSNGAGIILISPEGFIIEYALRFGFQASNNEAEYEALLAGIRLAHALKVDSLSVHSDSQLVVNHVLGDYEARDERMAQYLEFVKTSAIPRDQNTQADALSRLASAEAIDVRPSVYLELLKDRNINSQIEIGVIDQEPCWMDTIIKFLSTCELPSERHEVRNLRVKVTRYTLVEGVLYKKSFSLPYLRCLHPSESVYTLQEVHEGICGQHLGGRTLAQKILRHGYYWPTMQKDAIEFTRRCEKCKKFAPVSHTPVAPLTSVVSPIPFAMWGMDLLGPFPMASGQ